MLIYLVLKTLVLWALLSALAIYAWRSVDTFLTNKSYWA